MNRAFTKKRGSDHGRRAGSSSNGELPAGDPDPLTAEQVWGRLLAWQARREHSRAELEQKLSQIGADAHQAEAALARLAELGLQNDDRFAEALVRSQMQRGRGQRAIRQTLQQRGIASDHPALAEQTDQVDWVAQASALLQRRFGTQPAAVDAKSVAKEKARQVRFLQYRGFSLSQALAAIHALDRDSSLDSDAALFDQ